MSKNKNYVPTGNIALLQLLVQWVLLKNNYNGVPIGSIALHNFNKFNGIF